MQYLYFKLPNYFKAPFSKIASPLAGRAPGLWSCFPAGRGGFRNADAQWSCAVRGRIGHVYDGYRN
jgi:hypothetical protein